MVASRLVATMVMSHTSHINRLNVDEGVSVLLVEQNLDVIVSIAQRGYVMDKGMIVAELSGDEIRDELVVRKHLAL